MATTISALNLVNVAPDGTFHATGNLQTTPAEVDAIFDHLRQQQQSHLILYFHGGRTSEQGGLNTATALLSLFADRVGAHPVFFLWESSEAEVIPASLEGVGQQPFFQVLLNAVTKFVLSKLKPQATTRATGRLALVSNAAVKTHHAREMTGTAPLSEARRSEIKPVSKSEALQFAQYLKDNPSYQREVKKIARQTAAARARPRKRGAADAASDIQPHQLSAETTAQLQAVVKQQAASPTALTAAFFDMGALHIFQRVVQRLQDGTDHGVLTTVVEEIMREFYVDDIVGLVWNLMKEEARSSFLSNASLTGQAQHGGTYFLERLRDYVADPAHPPLKVSLVGHSAGSIYICRLLNKAAEILPNFQFHQIVFLAPGVDFELFKASIIDHPERYQRFRTYNLGDQFESVDAIITGIYTRSLLYFVSSLLEGVPEKPLVGMERFFSGRPPYDSTALLAVQQFVMAAGQGRAVYSVTDNGPAGLNCTAQHHGGFPFDPVLQDSLASLLRS